MSSAVPPTTATAAAPSNFVSPQDHCYQQQQQRRRVLYPPSLSGPCRVIFPMHLLRRLPRANVSPYRHCAALRSCLTTPEPGAESIPSFTGTVSTCVPKIKRTTSGIGVLERLLCRGSRFPRSIAGSLPTSPVTPPPRDTRIHVSFSFLAPSRIRSCSRKQLPEPVLHHTTRPLQYRYPPAVAPRPGRLSALALRCDSVSRLRGVE